jgi:hypothetical protein
MDEYDLASIQHPAVELAFRLDNIEYARLIGSVYQIWSDGEITLQKSGELLWQRTLHCITPCVVNAPAFQFPHTSPYDSKDTFAYVAGEEEAWKIRDLIGKDFNSETYHFVNSARFRGDK